MNQCQNRPQQKKKSFFTLCLHLTVFLMYTSTPVIDSVYLVLLSRGVRVRTSAPQALPSNHKTLKPLLFCECITESRLAVGSAPESPTIFQGRSLSCRIACLVLSCAGICSRETWTRWAEPELSVSLVVCGTQVGQLWWEGRNGQRLLIDVFNVFYRTMKRTVIVICDTCLVSVCVLQHCSNPPFPPPLLYRNAWGQHRDFNSPFLYIYTSNMACFVLL